ncbi:hypothetical protein [Amycolatopsis speibonae]|uniref:Uncharacterized protein n=1 Tax=Amycolatopsis speibonae TaxID=1450224 RepID=A0ABV7PD63_9PSEU
MRGREPQGPRARGAQLRPELAAGYAGLEAEIGHRFSNDLSMAGVITAAKQASPVSWSVPGSVDSE